MALEEQFEDFVGRFDDRVSIEPYYYIPYDYRLARKSRRPSDIFRANWESAEAIHGETSQFNEILLNALAEGEKREPQDFDVMVHLDIFVHGGNGELDYVQRFFSALSEEVDVQEKPIFLTYEPFNVDIRNTRFKNMVNFDPERSVSTIVAVDGRGRSAGSGFLALDQLERFFSITHGYKKDDRFRLHGGEWQACLKMAALMLTAIGIGKRWTWAGFSGPLSEIFDSQSTILDQAADLSSSTVKFGTVLDPYCLSTSQKICLEPHQLVMRKFHDERTRIITSEPPFTQE